jgi:hypothetical protein
MIRKSDALCVVILALAVAGSAAGQSFCPRGNCDKENPAKAQHYLTEYSNGAMEEIVDAYHKFFWHCVETGYQP